MADIITNKINMTNNIFKSSLPLWNLILFWKHIQHFFFFKVWWPLKVLTSCWEKAREPGDVDLWMSTRLRQQLRVSDTCDHLKRALFFSRCSCPELAAIFGWPGVFSVSWADYGWRQGKESWSASSGHWKDGHIWVSWFGSCCSQELLLLPELNFHLFHKFHRRAKCL